MKYFIYLLTVLMLVLTSCEDVSVGVDDTYMASTSDSIQSADSSALVSTANTIGVLVSIDSITIDSILANQPPTGFDFDLLSAYGDGIDIIFGGGNTITTPSHWNATYDNPVPDNNTRMAITDLTMAEFDAMGTASEAISLIDSLTLTGSITLSEGMVILIMTSEYDESEPSAGGLYLMAVGKGGYFNWGMNFLYIKTIVPE